MSGRVHRRLRRLADEVLQTTPIFRRRRRSVLRRVWDWCHGVEVRPEPNHRRLAHRNVKRQYRRWRARQA